MVTRNSNSTSGYLAYLHGSPTIPRTRDRVQAEKETERTAGSSLGESPL